MRVWVNPLRRAIPFSYWSLWLAEMFVFYCHAALQVLACTPSHVSSCHGDYEEFCSLDNFVLTAQDTLGSSLVGIHCSSCFLLALDSSHKVQSYACEFTITFGVDATPSSLPLPPPPSLPLPPSPLLLPALHPFQIWVWGGLYFMFVHWLRSIHPCTTTCMEACSQAVYVLDHIMASMQSGSVRAG